MNGLAYKRFQKDKAKERTRFKFKYIWGQSELAENPRIVGLNANNRQICSCYMCGNPRRYFGLKTMQELRRDI